MLVTMKYLLEDACKRNYAIGAFNCSSLESALAAIKAAEELNSGFILQHAPAHEGYLPIEIAGPIMLQLAKYSKIPVCVHLDHGNTIELCKRAIDMGFTSIMFDGSSLPYEENIKQTKEICSYAHDRNVSVEAELGSMPCNFRGELKEYTPEDFYTNPNQAKEFVEKTGVDALAISFGTVHGLYKTKPVLNFDIIKQIRKSTKGLPLVMHGGSGLSKEDFKNAIDSGIRKINYYTYGALAGGKAVYDIVIKTPNGLQYHDVSTYATIKIKENIAETIRIFNNGNTNN